MIAVYLAKAPERGILVKVAGELAADPNTGRLTASFPQLSYSSLIVHFREGQRSTLASSCACGTFNTGVDLTAWRDAALARHTDSAARVTAGVGGGPKGFPGASFPLSRTSFDFEGGEKLIQVLNRSYKAG